MKIKKSWSKNKELNYDKHIWENVYYKKKFHLGGRLPLTIFTWLLCAALLAATIVIGIYTNKYSLQMDRKFSQWLVDNKEFYEKIIVLHPGFKPNWWYDMKWILGWWIFGLVSSIIVTAACIVGNGFLQDLVYNWEFDLPYWSLEEVYREEIEND